MDFHIDRVLRLKTDIEYKNLYRWAINEVLENGEVVQRDQIPWVWTLWFIATECSVNDSFSIEPDYSTKSDENAIKSIERQSIDIRLRSGSPRLDEDGWRNPRFSMFGTGRILTDIRLTIHPLAEPNENETCMAWGCVSYTSEVDFRSRTEDDVLIFHLSVKPETFSRYAQLVRSGQLDELIFSAGKVSGFYSDWSPSISTDSVKVLAAGKEQAVDTTARPDIELPRLGTVGECSLRINRSLAFRRQAVEPSVDGPAVEDRPQHLEPITPPAASVTPPAMPDPDPQLRQLLRSLKTAAWLIVVLLAVITVRTLLR
jgi:hypothetical protein